MRLDGPRAEHELVGDLAVRAAGGDQPGDLGLARGQRAAPPSPAHGDSCQDGAGPPPLSSFTGLAEFVVKKGTGKYAGYRGHGLATFVEDAADHDRMTLIGRISR